MARAAGFRAEADRFWWAIVEDSEHGPVLLEQAKAVAPAGSSEAEALSWLRDRALLLIKAHQPTVATVRSAETIARGGNTDGARRRLRIEGVLLQALHSRGIKVLACGLATVASQLSITPTEAKAYLEGDDLRGVDISKLRTGAKESVLVAVAALADVGA